MMKEGSVHDGIELQFNGERHRINLKASGKGGGIQGGVGMELHHATVSGNTAAGAGIEGARGHMDHGRVDD